MGQLLIVQLYGLPPRRPQIGRLKTPTPRAANYREKIVAADQIVWVTPIEDNGKNMFSDEIDWTQDFDQACPSPITTTTTWIHHHTKHGSTSTIKNWTHNKELYVSDTEAATACQIFNTGQNLVHWCSGTWGNILHIVFQEL